LVAPYVAAQQANGYPLFMWWNTAGPVDGKKTQIYQSPSGGLVWEFINEASSATTQFFAVNRTGYTAASITLTAPTVQITGSLSVTSAATVTGRATVSEIMCTSGVFRVANNDTYYMARDSGGTWSWVEGGTANLRLDN